jgi:hypothetical protein
MSTNSIVPETRPHLLGIYLNDHLAGSAGGAALARRLLDAHKGTPAEGDLTEFVRQVNADRDALIEIMSQLGLPRTYYKETLATVAERVGRLKLNGGLLRRSPLSSVVEFEGMALGVTGKRSAWRSLRLLAETEPRLDKDRLDALISAADEQLAILERLRVQAVQEALAAA